MIHLRPERVTVAAPTAATQSPEPALVSGLRAEGSDRSAWVGVSTAALSRDGSPGREVIRSILKNDGKVVLVHYSGYWNERDCPHLAELRRDFGGDRVAVLASRGFATENLWLCDYLGFFGFGANGDLEHLQVHYLQGDCDGGYEVRAPIKFPDRVRRGGVWEGVYAKGGDLLVLDTDTIALSERAYVQNIGQLNDHAIAATLNRIGMKRAVVLPSTDNDLEHVDTMVTMINGNAFIPAFYEGDEGMLRDRFARARVRLETAGFPVFELPMMAPSAVGSCFTTVSPCNLRLFRAVDGSLRAVVPVPEGAPQRYRDLLTSVLMEKGGLDRVIPLDSSPTNGGLIHCMTAEIPGCLLSPSLTLDQA